MSIQNYVAAVDRLDSPECDYSVAGTPPLPGVVLLEVRGSDDAVSYRYTTAGHGVGEVWYPGEEEARGAIAAEFAGCLGAWELVPSGEADPHDYAVCVARGVRGAGRREA